MPAAFRPVKGPSQSLSYLAAEAIRERIESGELAPGERMPPERVLTEQLAVSRASLREALKMLESIGMVEARVGRGRFVVNHTDERQSLALVANWLHAHRQEIAHLNEIRTAVEPVAVAGVPPERRAETAERLRPILAEAEDAVRRADSVRAAALDREFHRVLCEQTPNRPLQALVLGLADAAQQAATAVYAVPQAARTSLRQHARLIESLASGDVEGAKRLLEEHFRSAVEAAEKARAGGSR